MILESKAIVEDADRLGLTSSTKSEMPTGIVPLTISGANREPSLYTIGFTSPVMQYIPPAFDLLHIRCRFARTYDAEYVPCYLMNLNHVALAKFYPKSNLSECGKIDDGLFRRLDFRGGRRAALSSINIFLPGHAEERVQDLGQEAIRKCFEYCWWHLPTPEGAGDTSCVHNLVYHQSRRIKNVIQLRKTLLRVVKIHRPDTRNIMPGGVVVRCSHADVALLVSDGRRIFWENRRTLISDNMSRPIKEGDLVNAIIATQDIKQPKIFMVIGSTSRPIQPIDTGAILGLVIWNILRHKEIGSSLTRVGDLDAITKCVSDILEADLRQGGVFHPGFSWKFTQSDTREALSLMFPLYVCEKNSVYHLPPAAISSLLVHAPLALSKIESVNAVARMFDLISADTAGWRENAHSSLIARTDWNASALSGLDGLLLRMPTVAIEIVLSKIFAKYAGIEHAGVQSDVHGSLFH